MDSVNSLEWPLFLQHYSGFCFSEPGKEAALNLIPANSIPDANELLQLTADTYFAHEQVSFGALSNLYDSSPIVSRLKKEAVLDGPELAKLVKLADVSQALSELRSNTKLRERAADLLALIGTLTDLGNPIKPVRHAIDEFGVVKDSASPALRSLRDQERKIHSEARDRLDALLQAAFRNGYLQDKFFDYRDGKYLIPVKSEFKNKIDGFAVESSTTKATIFMEPAGVRDCNDRIKQIQLQIEEEVYRILAELTHSLHPHADSFALNYEALLALDLHQARGAMARHFASIRGVSRPIFSRRFRFDELYHPLLAFVLAPGKIVRNSFILGPDKRILVISGPNTGGKTILLKALGISSLMARAGFFLTCAGEAELPFFHSVLAQIGDAQNLELSLSSFSGSIVHLKQVLEGSDSGSLVLVDEILHATDPDEASALSQAILESLHERGAYAVVTTHLSGLKVANNQKFEGASMEFDPKEMSPTYRLRMGVPGSSRALEIAEKLGLSKSVIEVARGFLSADRIKEQNALDNLERQERELEEVKIAAIQDRETLENKLREVSKIESELKTSRERFRVELLGKIRSQQKEAMDELNRAINLYREKLKTVDQKHEATLEIQENLSQVQESFQTIERTLLKEIPASITLPELDEPKKSDEFVQNGTVLVKTMGAEGILLSDPKKRGKTAEIMVGNMRMHIAWENLVFKHPKQNGSKGRVIPSVNPECPAEMNIIGLTVYDAAPKIESYLDLASRSGRPSVRIVHGHGSGSLRKAVRDLLSKVPYDIKYRGGAPSEGGDGCTVVEFS